MDVGTLAIDPATPSTLYAAGGNGVFKSLNGGSSWQATGLGWNVYALAIDPTSPATLYAGTLGAGVFRSFNGGGSWQQTGLGGPVVCGDAFAGCGEQCDDGGESATCNANCTFARCGDGILNVVAGEQCDDGNRNRHLSRKLCLDLCIRQSCGGL